MTHDRRDSFNLDVDPGADPVETARKMRESRPRISCLGCVVTGGPAIAAIIGLVVLIVYVIGRLA